MIRAHLTTKEWSVGSLTTRCKPGKINMGNKRLSNKNSRINKDNGKINSIYFNRQMDIEYLCDHIRLSMEHNIGKISRVSLALACRRKRTSTPTEHWRMTMRPSSTPSLKTIHQQPISRGEEEPHTNTIFRNPGQSGDSVVYVFLLFDLFTPSTSKGMLDILAFHFGKP